LKADYPFCVLESPILPMMEETERWFADLEPGLVGNDEL
jgi:hypothetical protein